MGNNSIDDYRQTFLENLGLLKIDPSKADREEIIWYVKNHAELRVYTRRLSQIWWELSGGFYVFTGQEYKDVYMVVKDVFRDCFLELILNKLADLLSDVDEKRKTRLGQMKCRLLELIGYIENGYQSGDLDYQDWRKASEVKLMLRPIEEELANIRDEVETLVLSSFPVDGVFPQK